MEKYYDLIVSMIKQHRKYSGCESILEDIVKDVYEHAAVVAGTVENEDVLKSYLEKIVATSMITVPKKMGISLRRQSSAAVPDLKTIVKPVPPVSEPVMIEEPAIEHEDVEDDELLEDLVINEPELSIKEEPVQEENELTFDEEPEQEETVEVENIEEEIPHVVLEKVDVSLVDKMINGVNNENDQETTLLEEETEEDEQSELSEEQTETEEDSEILPLEEAEDEDSSFNVENDTVEELVSEEPEKEVAEEVDFEFDEPADEDNLTSEEESEELLSDNESDTLITEEETELVQDDALETSLESDEILVAETSDDLLTGVDNELEDVTENAPKSKEISLPDYKCFDFEPEQQDEDNNDLLEEVKAFDSKHPEKRVIEVCRMKYNEKMSVGEIAKSLGMSEEEVLDSLNEIMFLVKD